jgi:hypothetical protein
MHVTMLSESISPAVPIIFFGAIALGLVAVAFVFASKLLARSAARQQSTAVPTTRSPASSPVSSLARSLAIAIGWIATVAGALLILMLATTRGGAPRFMYIAAALPLLAGIRILQQTRRRGAHLDDAER